MVLADLCSGEQGKHGSYSGLLSLLLCFLPFLQIKKSSV